MRLLVTGGAGFIGSALVFHAVGTGDDVMVVDDLSAGSIANVHPGGGFRKMDVSDPDARTVVSDFAPDAVVHLAAQTDVSASIADPEHDRRVNVEGTRAVTRAAREAGARRVVYASSAAVYGEPSEVPLRETSEKRPANPYGESKYEAESVIAETLEGSETDFAFLRFANVFGPRQDWTGEGGVVAIFSAKMARDERPVIYGDGEQTRDFIYVADVVSGILAALAADGRLAGAGDEAAFNISTGTELSVNRLYAHIADAAGFYRPPEYAPAREGDIARSALDPSKARDRLGWVARAPLPDALAGTVEWFAKSR